MASSINLLDLTEELPRLKHRVDRHLWLNDLLHWVRGDRQSASQAAARLGLLVDALLARPEMTQAWQNWWQCFVRDADVTPLLADLGFTSRSAFISDLGQRLRMKLLPSTPDTRDMGALFLFLKLEPFDVQWMQALDEHTLRSLTRLVLPHAPTQAPPTLQASLMDALTYCVGQVNATGHSAEIRTRMASRDENTRPFHDLPMALENFRQALKHGGPHSLECQVAAQGLKDQLDDCRHAAYTVYSHLQEHGISVGIVFRLRQLRHLVIRCKHLLETLLTHAPVPAMLALIAHLAQVSHDSRSIGSLWAANSHMLAEKVAQRSAENGEHYITRNGAEYQRLLGKALGGGAVIGLTTWGKFTITALALSPFWAGLAAGTNYALSFVLVMLLHWTVATKQPAVTAPAMAAKLKQIDNDEGVEGFVDEVAHLFRSQIAAILGNLLAVVPVVLLICWGLVQLGLNPMANEAEARYVLSSVSLLGPTALFAAFTGVLLFASSIIAGWVENAFVLHRLDSALRYHPQLRRWIGVRGTERLGLYLQHNISGLAANISLGLMLGLVPVIALFFGLSLDVRHVTLTAGQIAAAVFTLGLPALSTPAFAWALAGLAVIGPLNLGVSFYLAFRVALASQGVSGVNRHRIRRAIGQRIRAQPLSFFRPPQTTPSSAL
jgi:site-specific recombinase